MQKLDRDFDEVLGRFLSHDWRVANRSTGRYLPSVESYMEGDKLIIPVDLPGLDQKDVAITVDGNLLGIRGSRINRSAERQRNFLLNEVTYGNFEREITVPGGIKSDQIETAYSDGVLQLTLRLGEAGRSRKVPVKIDDEDEKRARRQ